MYSITVADGEKEVKLLDRQKKKWKYFNSRLERLQWKQQQWLVPLIRLFTLYHEQPIGRSK